MCWNQENQIGIRFSSTCGNFSGQGPELSKLATNVALTGLIKETFHITANHSECTPNASQIFLMSQADRISERAFFFFSRILIDVHKPYC